jgi:flagellar hook protein FlgE
MAFTTALSGLNAAANNLAVTGNNIANANTTGFKKSRSEFADVYASSIGGIGKNTPGAGVRVSNVAQQFNQGNLEFTENSLDLAISGEGFFTLAQSPTELEDKVYTRSGEFKLDKNGAVVNNQGQALLVYKPNGTKVTDGFSQGVLQSIQLNATQGLPAATENVRMQVNLNADDPVITAAFDLADTTTYTTQTSATVYDTLGESHIMTTYFVSKGVDTAATPPAATPPGTGYSKWAVYHAVDGNAIDVNNPALPATDLGANGEIGETLYFDSAGQLKFPAQVVGGSTTVGSVSLNSFTIPNSSAAPIQVSMDYDKSTQISAKFSVDNLTQDGLPAGRLTGVDIDDNGVIFARFSNGGSTPLGKVALTRFSSPQGLAKLGDTLWGQSASSGEPIPGEAGANNFGLVQSGALEGSNVDLAAQLVNLIVAQQAYQANAKTITTEDTITQTILNIR